MSKIKTIIIDDEKLARDIIKNYLKNFDHLEVVDECSNGLEGIKSINTHKPDLIFLDIQMPKINGFEMLEILDEIPVVIFTTAFDHYAIKAFEVNATDYLLKPFSLERFTASINKAMEQLNNLEKIRHNLRQLLDKEDSGNEKLQRIVVKKGTEIVIIPVNEINYIEAQDDYVMIYRSDKKYLKQKTMRFYENNLDPNIFVRIHRSYITPIDKIKRIEPFEKESYRVELLGGAKLPVSKSGYAKLKQLL